MTTYLTALLFLAFGCVHPASMSFPTLLEDEEGSGYDLGGSGSGDWSEKGEISNMKAIPSSKDLASETTYWPPEDIGSYFVSGTDTKSFMENKQIFSAVIAGGVTGMILAAILTALLIYKWQDKDNGGYVMGQHVHREIVIV
ncbi:Syndecan-3 Precursor [Channa argus]|uniref:Syndecan-3 n=1 Tax=Channa argus TaxID=215402 RepID=A0A6G1QJV0_CHAAH|nr:Syndecan-3 Precursor [Channa argus]